MQPIEQSYQSNADALKSLQRIASDAGVPGIAVFWVCAPEPLANVLHRVRDGHAGKILYALVAQLTGDVQSNRRAVRSREILSIHAVGKESLQMPGVRHVDALPPHI
jgi:hypothetical protein